jgi:hypothetical protein
LPASPSSWVARCLAAPLTSAAVRISADLAAMRGEQPASPGLDDAHGAALDQADGENPTPHGPTRSTPP